ncbi:hypothetical protein VUR80DRAFT_5428 [Thermomyces stellatus]
MAFWFDTGRHAIFESLAEVCDRIDSGLKAEQEKARTELESLRSQAAQVDRLAQENQSLRAQLRQLQQRLDSPKTPQNPQQLLAGQQPPGPSRIRGSNEQHLQPLTPQSANQPPRSNAPPVATVSDDNVDWKREAAKNATKYHRIRAELDIAKDALVKRLAEVEDWKTYAERLKKKVAEFEAKYEAEGARGGASASDAPGPRARDSCNAFSDGTKHRGLPRGGDGQPEAGTRTDSSVTAGSTRELMPSSPPRKMSSTDGQEDCCPTQSDSTEENQENSEMALPDLPRQENLPEGPMIKKEPSSDIPVVVSERSMRKRKRRGSEEQQRSPLRVKQEDDEPDPPVTADLCDFSPATSVDLDEPGTRLDTPRKHRQLEAIRTGGLNSHGLNARDEAASARPGTGRISNTSRALQPLSPNVRTPQPQRPLKKGIGHAVSEVAEDGGIYEVPSAKPTVPPRTEPTTGRLAGLLNRPAVEAESPLIRQKDRLDRTPRLPPDPSWPQAPQPRELPFGKHTRDRLKAQEDKIPRASTASPGCGTSKHGSKGSTPAARSKPPSDLRLEDFKINPDFNNGYDYAYTEVVRNKDERACIPGCVDMDCCGKHFRAMALAERGNGPRTPAQLAEDRRLLENYLGDEAYRLFSMTKEEKDEVWLEAKTRELADRIGKHRHRFTRMKSPPGFWRTDFPSTQEEEQDKAAAVQREKEMIHERYREAMRPGGKWVFKDR